jgi:hypothetical protein
MTSMSYTQAQDSTISIKVSDLEKLVPGASVALKKATEVEATEAALEKRIERYGSYVGVGKEIGIAVNSALEAVNDQVVKFSETKLGKITVFLVVWKVLYKDVLGIIIGIPLLLGWTAIFVWVMVYFFMKRKIKYTDKNGQVVEEIVDNDWNDNKWAGIAVTGIGYVVIAWVIVGGVIL